MLKIKDKIKNKIKNKLYNLTLKEKITILATILIVLIACCLITAILGLERVRLAKNEGAVADKIQDNFQELRILFEQSLMGPHDYLIHGGEEEKEIFLLDFKGLQNKKDFFKNLIIKEKMKHSLEFEEIVGKAQARFCLIEEKLPEFELEALDIFNLDFLTEIHRAGLYMEEMDSFVRGLETELKEVGAIMLELSDKAKNRIEAIHFNLFILLIVLGMAAIFIGVILSYYLIRSITMPINNLVQSARRIKNGDLTVRAKIETRDEIAELACSFNEMVDELLDVQERVSSILQGTGDAMRVIDKDFTIIQCNKRMQELTGIRCSEAVDKKCYEIFFSKLCHTGDCHLKRILGGEKWIEIDIIKETRDGRAIPVEVVVTPLKRKGEIIGMIESIRDLSERHKAQEALRESKEKFRLIAETSIDFICQFDLQGKISYCSPAVKRVLGYLPEEFIGKDFKDYLLPIESSKVEGAFQGAISGQPIGFLEVQLFSKKGVARSVEINATPLKKRGKVIGIQAIVRDITDRKQAEEELSSTKTRLEYLLKASPVIIYSCLASQGFSMTFISENIFTQLGYSSQEVLYDHNFWIKNIHPDDRRIVLNKVNGIIEKGQQIIEYRFLGKDGAYRWIHDELRLMKDNRGAPAEIIGYLVDITKHKGLEEQLLHSQKMEAIGRLAGGIAHDFNNLLQTINGMSELLSYNYAGQEALCKDIEEIRKAGKRAASLTNQLLAFSRRQMIQPKILDLNTIVSDTGKMLRRLIGEDIELVTILGPELGYIKADKGQIEQVIMNLAVNARDAMPKGGKLIIKSQMMTFRKDAGQGSPKPRSGEFICLSIKDTGIGMEKEIIDRIFEPFYSTKGVGKGTGLGLSMVYGIITQHEGWIHVDSEPGFGSNFQIYLPAYPKATEKEIEENVTLQELKGKGERILLVEDEVEVREFTSRALQESGYVVSNASQAQEAIEIFKREKGKFHLVISDVVLTDSTALEIIDQLYLYNPDLRILLSSGYSDHKSQWPIICEKGYPFLQKPYSLVDLLQAVKKVCR